MRYSDDPVEDARLKHEVLGEPRFESDEAALAHLRDLKYEGHQILALYDDDAHLRSAIDRLFVDFNWVDHSGELIHDFAKRMAEEKGLE